MLAIHTYTFLNFIYSHKICEHPEPATVDLIQTMTRFHMYELALFIIPYLASAVINFTLWYYTASPGTSSFTEHLNLENGTISRQTVTLNSYHFMLLTKCLAHMPLYFLAVAQIFYFSDTYKVSDLIFQKPIIYFSYFVYMLDHSLSFIIYLKFHKQFKATVKALFTF